jgi:hypothetical protein
MVNHRRRLRSLPTVGLGLLLLSCGAEQPKMVIWFKVAQEVFRPEYLVVSFVQPDGQSAQGIRVPYRGELAQTGPVLGSLELDMGGASEGDRTLIAWGIRGYATVSGARARVRWNVSLRRDVTLTLGCWRDVEGGIAALDGYAVSPPSGECPAGAPPGSRSAAPDAGNAPLPDAGAAVPPAPPPGPGDPVPPPPPAPPTPPPPPVESPDAGVPPPNPPPPVDAAAPPPPRVDAAAPPPLQPPPPQPDAALPDPPPPQPDAAPADPPPRGPPPRGTDLQSGLTVYLRLDDGTGSSNARDSSGNGNTGRLERLDPQRAWVPGLYGTALAFDGQGWVAIGESASINAINEGFGFSAWIRRTGDGTILARRSVGANGFLYRFFVEGGKLGVQINSSNGARADLLSSRTVPARELVHVAASYDLTTVRLFIDGSDAGIQSYGLNIGPENSPLNVGSRQDATLVGADDIFAGVIDELAVYNRALSAQDVRALAAGFQPQAR